MDFASWGTVWIKYNALTVNVASIHGIVYKEEQSYSRVFILTSDNNLKWLC